jgi:hypothetical protein
LQIIVFKITLPGKSFCFFPRLYSFVSRAAGAFGDCPADIVEGAFSPAGFAVQAIGWIGRLYDALNGLVYACRTESNAGGIKFGGAFLGADVPV